LKRLLRIAGNIDLPHNPIFQLFVTYGKLHSDYSPLQAIKIGSEDWKLHSRKIHFKTTETSIKSVPYFTCWLLVQI